MGWIWADDWDYPAPDQRRPERTTIIGGVCQLVVRRIRRSNGDRWARASLTANINHRLLHIISMRPARLRSNKSARPS